MKRSNYLLKIEEPCSESWTTMLSTDSGRFCAACAKKVTDFTKLSDDQVLAILKKPSGNLCGRLEESQMNRFLMNKSEPSNKARFFRFVAGLFLLSAAEGKAQEMIVREPMAMVKPPTEQEKFEKKKRGDSNYSLKKWIEGRVISAETKEPVAGVWVMNNGAGYTAITDSLGYFKKLLPDSLIASPDRFTFFHPRSDYGRISFSVMADDLPLIVELPPPSPKVTVFGGRLTVVKRKWWQRRKKYCK